MLRREWQAGAMISCRTIDIGYLWDGYTSSLIFHLLSPLNITELVEFYVIVIIVRKNYGNDLESVEEWLRKEEIG